MDIRTLAKVLQEANRLLPPDIREDIAKALDKGAEVLMEFGEQFDQATAKSSKENAEDVWATYADNIRAGMSFDDIIKDFDTNVADNGVVPDAESGGSGSVPSVDSITRDIYRFIATVDEDYAAPSPVFEEWNVQHPMFIAVDYIKYLAEEELSRMDDEG